MCGSTSTCHVDLARSACEKEREPGRETGGRSERRKAEESYVRTVRKYAKDPEVNEETAACTRRRATPPPYMYEYL